MTLHYSFSDLFQAADARRARDLAIAKVSASSSDFIAAGLLFISRLQGEYTGEEIRLAMQEQAIVPPTPNAMGALIKTAAKRGLIVPTGTYRQMETERSHARETRVWRVGAA
jgi:hypothetical protein